MPLSSGSCRIHGPDRTTPRPMLYSSIWVKQLGSHAVSFVPKPIRFGAVIAS